MTVLIILGLVCVVVGGTLITIAARYFRRGGARDEHVQTQRFAMCIVGGLQVAAGIGCFIAAAAR